MTRQVYNLPNCNQERWCTIVDRLSTNPVDAIELSNTIRSFQGLPEASKPFDVLEEAVKSYNKRFNCNFIRDVVPSIYQNALSLPELFPNSALGLLVSGNEESISITRMQCRCLLSHAFLCTLEELEVEGHQYGFLSFLKIYTSYCECDEAVQRLLCMVHYLKISSEDQFDLSGDVVFKRHVGLPEKMPNWKLSNQQLCDVTISDTVLIENAPAAAHVDFANKRLHIFRIIPSCTQEEVLFSFRPELFLTLMFCDVLSDNEAVTVTGARKYCNYSGYLDTFQFEGDATPSQSYEPPCIIAIDALVNFYGQEYREDMLLRDLNKAFIGFNNSEIPQDCDPTIARTISTGGWGTGVFAGTPLLKFFQQVMASSEAGRTLHYCTFKNPSLAKKLNELYQLARSKNITVGILYNMLLSYGEYDHLECLHEYLKKRFNEVQQVCDENVTKREEPKVSCTYVQSTEFYNMFVESTSTFIDLRSYTEFETSHLYNSFNIPSDIEDIERYIESNPDELYYGCGERSGHFAFIAHDPITSENSNPHIKRVIEFYMNQHKQCKAVYLLSDSGTGFIERFPFLTIESTEGLYPNMIDDNLFISGYSLATNQDIISTMGITHIINCCAKTVGSPFSTQGVNYFNIHFEDEKTAEAGASLCHYAHKCNDYIQNALQNSGKVLVHCYQGKSRSVSIVIAHYMLSRGMNYTDAFQKVRKARPIAQPNPMFQNVLSSLLN